MATKKYTIYQHDLKPDLEIVCARDGHPVDLTQADGVKVIGLLDGQPLFSRPATVAGPDGVVIMEWEEGDTATLGALKVEVEALWPGEKPETFRPPELLVIIADFG